MRFAHIEMLFLIWAVPLLFAVFYYGIRKRNRIIGKYISAEQLHKLLPEKAFSGRKRKIFFYLLGVTFLIVSLTGPQYGYRWEEMQQRGVDIMIAMDCSKSMLADDIKPTRLDRAKHEVIDLLNMLEGDRAGLVAFSGTAFLQCPLTLDYQAFYIFLNVLTPDYLPVGGTDIAGALETAINAFDPDSPADKAVILITDGEATGDNPEKAAEKAKELGVKVFTIGIGSDEGVPVPEVNENGVKGFKKDLNGNIVITKLDENALKKISDVSGGEYVRSIAGDMDLKRIYENRIKSGMKAAELESGKKRVWEDRFQWVLFPALLFLLIEMLLPGKMILKRKLFIWILISFTAIPFLHADAHADSFRKSVEAGADAYQKGDFDKALDQFAKAQVERPESPEVLYDLGNSYYKKGDYASALQNYRQAEELYKKAHEGKTEKNGKELPFLGKTAYNSGNALFKSGKMKEALSSYEKALELMPDDENTKKNIDFVKWIMENQPPQNNQQSGDSNDDDKKGDKKDQEESQKNKNGGDKKSDEKQNENQQKDQNQPGDDNKNQAAGDKNGGENDERNKDDNAGFGNELPNDGNDGRNAEAGESNDDNAGSDEEMNASKAQAGPKDGNDEDENRKSRAAHMLNRLKDKPGKALMGPQYNQRQVDKDW